METAGVVVEEEVAEVEAIGVIASSGFVVRFGAAPGPSIGTAVVAAFTK